MAAFEAITCEEGFPEGRPKSNAFAKKLSNEQMEAVADLFAPYNSITLSGPVKQNCYKYTISESQVQDIGGGDALVFSDYTAKDPLRFDIFSGSFVFNTEDVALVGKTVTYQICSESLLGYDDPIVCWSHTFNFSSGN